MFEKLLTHSVAQEIPPEILGDSFYIDVSARVHALILRQGISIDLPCSGSVAGADLFRPCPDLDDETARLAHWTGCRSFSLAPSAHARVALNAALSHHD
jgi:hypothetical protein